MALESITCPILALCLRLVKYLYTSVSALFSKLYASNFAMSRPCGMQSDSLEKSVKIDGTLFKFYSTIINVLYLGRLIVFLKYINLFKLRTANLEFVIEVNAPKNSLSLATWVCYESCKHLNNFTMQFIFKNVSFHSV